jgi:very-short-patch-repair endonuclease
VGFKLPPLLKGGWGGFYQGQRMLPYSAKLKTPARDLRRNLTESEQVLWHRLRAKQILGIQFYRQKPLGRYIVDFFAPRVKLVVEVDGSQHLEENQLQEDKHRDQYLSGLGLKVLRFDSRVVLTETDAVMEVIYKETKERLGLEIPPHPPFSKGGTLLS